MVDVCRGRQCSGKRVVLTSVRERQCLSIGETCVGDPQGSSESGGDDSRKRRCRFGLPDAIFVEELKVEEGAISNLERDAILDFRFGRSRHLGFWKGTPS